MDENKEMGSNILGSNLHTWDWVIIALYLVIVIIVGIWSSRRSKKESVGDYFLASRNVHWILVGGSLFGSNIGSGHFIGLAGAAASSGIAVSGYELSSPFILCLLGWLFLPVYMSAGIYTMPEYLRERFGGQRIRIYLSILSLLLYIFTSISTNLYTGALFIQLALNKTSPEWLYISILILLTIAAVFTIAGGLTTVIWTDLVQSILMIFGACILMVFAFAEVGGYQKMVEKYPYAVASKRAGNGSCGIPPSNYLSLLRSPSAPDFPGTGMTFGLAILATWYWCSDQIMVQRVLASKNMTHAKAGCILASYLKILPLCLMVFPGMIARILYPERVGCADPEECKKICGSPGGCTNIAYVELVIHLLPTGLSGLMLAVMMAALMSSLTSIFNSAATIFTIDIWTRFRKTASDPELVVAGKLFVILMVIISVAWVPILQTTSTRLIDYVQGIFSYLAPPICSVYLLAILWPRANEPGAFWGLMVGLLIGVARFVLQFSLSHPPCGSDQPDTQHWFLIIVGKVHYLHFACILFAITTLFVTAISLITEPIPEERLYRLTFWTRKSSSVRKEIKKKKKSENVLAPGDIKSEEPSIFVKLVYRLLGFDITSAPKNKQTQRQLTQNDKEEAAKKAADFLYESPYNKKLMNISAIICMCITSFIYGFYS